MSIFKQIINRKTLKKVILLFGLLLFSAALKAQYNYSEWGIGVSASKTAVYSDLRQNDKHNSFSADVYYNYSPYLPFGLEVQAGKLSGGNNLTDPSHRYFVNDFLSVSVHGDLQLGEIIDYDRDFFSNIAKGLYMGLGVGVIHNKLTSIRRYSIDGGYHYPGKNSSLNVIVPIRFGYEIKIFNYDEEPMIGLDLGYIHNVTFGEGLDGYNDPSKKFKNNSPDMFSQITVGIKVNFGAPVSYIKSIKGSGY